MAIKLELEGKAVELIGSENDLQCLSKLLDDIRILKKDGSYYLKDPLFDTITDDWQVLSKAEGTVKALNEYAKVRCDDFQSVETSDSVHTFEGREKKKINFLVNPATAVAVVGSVQKNMQEAQDALDAKKILYKEARQDVENITELLRTEPLKKDGRNLLLAITDTLSKLL
jgi:hypothetical protein